MIGTEEEPEIRSLQTPGLTHRQQQALGLALSCLSGVKAEAWVLYGSCLLQEETRDTCPSALTECPRTPGACCPRCPWPEKAQPQRASHC